MRLLVTAFIALCIPSSVTINPSLADNNAPSSHLGGISMDVYPERVNSTRDLEDKDPGDGICFTGKNNCLGQPECTLRAFIQEANARKGKDRIEITSLPTCDPGYNSESHVHTIRPKSALPEITGPVEIEGCAAGSEGCLPSIEINGSSAGGNADGLKITSGNSTVSGLIINGFSGAGIALSVKGKNTIKGNYIGTDYKGTSSVANTQGGIVIDNSYDNKIGGPTENDINLISGNSVAGVVIKGKNSTNNEILGNYIGVNIDGDCKRDSRYLCEKNNTTGNLYGVLIFGASGNIIGDGNIISDNKQSGILISSINSTHNKVIGNLIGLAINGYSRTPNGANGIEIKDGRENIIGGSSEYDRNTICGNTKSGIVVYSSNSINGAGRGAGTCAKAGCGNQILGNAIGIIYDQIGGFLTVGNDIGVYLNSVPSNTVGTGNIISGNSTAGLKISGLNAQDNKIIGNMIGDKIGVGNPKGVLIENAAKNVIGGSDKAHRNIISGNGEGTGIEISGKKSTGNKAIGNFIGSTDNGEERLRNIIGVSIIDAPGNVIGGKTKDERNLISGNDTAIKIKGKDAAGNKIIGNLIGTKINGREALGNFLHGIEIIDAPKNFIGEGTEDTRNIISGNGYGIYIETAKANNILGNFIGTDISGTKPLPNREDGIFLIPGTSETFIADNVISGNHFGIEIFESNNNRLEGNKIGTDHRGKSAVSNHIGINIELSSGNRIGPDNVISANDGEGIIISESSSGTVIEGNKIGTTIDGNVGLGNGKVGIEIGRSTTNTIGGSTRKARNIISDNKGQGIYIHTGSDGNRVQGNKIGTDPTGTMSLGNEGSGIEIDNSNGNFIGMDPTHDRAQRLKEINIISNNKGAGISVKNGQRNTITRNLIFNNGDSGIALSSANRSNSFGPPELISAKSGTGVTIKAAYRRQPPTGLNIEFFYSPTCINGKEQGQKFVGSMRLDPLKFAGFSYRTRLRVVSGNFITATATDPEGNTSVFSNCVRVQ
jgi:parallel beta-helix repeat protein